MLVVWRCVCFVLVVLFYVGSWRYGWLPRFQNSFKIHPSKNTNLVTNNTKSFQNPSKIHPKSTKLVPRNRPKATLEASRQKRGTVVEKLTPFWRHFGDLGRHLGSTWVPRGSLNRAFWHQDTPKSWKMRPRIRHQKKVWFFDWILIGKCEIVNVVNSPKCFIYKHFGVFRTLCESWEVHWKLKLKQSSKCCKIVLVGYLGKAVSF